MKMRTHFGRKHHDHRSQGRSMSEDVRLDRPVVKIEKFCETEYRQRNISANNATETRDPNKHNHQAQRKLRKDTSMPRLENLPMDSAALLLRCKKLLMDSHGLDETPNALRHARRPLPPLREACSLPIPLTEKLGDRSGDLRRTRHARFHMIHRVRRDNHSQGTMKQDTGDKINATRNQVCKTLPRDPATETNTQGDKPEADGNWTKLIQP